MADLEQDIFDAGASAPPPGEPALEPEPSVSPTPPESRMVSDAIAALRGPVPNYGVPPQPPRPPDPDQQPVTSGQLRDLLHERAERQRLQNILDGYQQAEAERARQQHTPRAEEQMFTDPNGFEDRLLSTIRREIAQTELKADMRVAALQHGPAFREAWAAFYRQCDGGRDPVTYFRVMNAPSPGEELVQWHRERQIVEQTGGDIGRYRERVLEEALRDEAFLSRIAERVGGVPRGQPYERGTRARDENGRFMAGQSAGDQQPRHEVRLPTSLSRLNGSSRGGMANEPEDGSEEAIFDAGRAPRRY